MQVHGSLIELVGNTPLVRLRRVTQELSGGGAGPQVLAKVEYFNPGGSVKDRIALRMVEAAEASGQLRPGGTIIDRDVNAARNLLKLAASGAESENACGGTVRPRSARQDPVKQEPGTRTRRRPGPSQGDTGLRMSARALKRNG